MCSNPLRLGCGEQDLWTWIAVIALVLALVFLFS